MKETQIPFTGEMVRAIIEGRKTQTRRLVKKFRIAGTSGECQGPDGYDTVTDHRIMRVPWDERTIQQIACPYGQPGDRLWVRETWAWPGKEEVIYRADPDLAALVEKWKTDPNYPQIKWSPSIHMPRWASRLTLEITKIRVERVQQISDADAKAEGIEVRDGDLMSPGEYYSVLWDKLPAKRGFDWEANPWVWVIEFE